MDSILVKPDCDCGASSPSPSQRLVGSLSAGQAGSRRRYVLEVIPENLAEVTEHLEAGAIVALNNDSIRIRTSGR